jgi:hypothetical protein
MTRPKFIRMIILYRICCFSIWFEGFDNKLFDVTRHKNCSLQKKCLETNTNSHDEWTSIDNLETVRRFIKFWPEYTLFFQISQGSRRDIFVPHVERGSEDICDGAYIFRSLFISKKIWNKFSNLCMLLTFLSVLHGIEYNWKITISYCGYKQRHYM